MTLCQWMACMERHTERLQEQEKLERIRTGTMTAAIMNMLGSKKDKSGFAPWDIFPELMPQVEADEEANSYAILAMFEAMAAGQQARIDNG